MENENKLPIDWYRIEEVEGIGKLSDKEVAIEVIDDEGRPLELLLNNEAFDSLRRACNRHHRRPDTI